jgi:hypothetical protein
MEIWHKFKSLIVGLKNWLFLLGCFMKQSKQQQIEKEVAFFNQNKNIENVPGKNLNDRRWLALLTAWKMYRSGRIQDTFMSLITGLMGGQIMSESSIELCYKKFNEKLKDGKDVDNE